MAIIGNGITTGAAGLDEMITVSDTQPTVPSNKVWVKETSSEIVIPTTEELSDVKNAIDVLMPTATAFDIGKALLVSSIDSQTGKPTEYVYGNTGGGLSATSANLLLTILNEGVYGTDQSANIELLRKALLEIEPVSISAVLDSVPYVGLHYSDLKFIVTATFDDASTLIVDNYRVMTTGDVTSGENTVTVGFRFKTCEVTFTASTVQTYTITNNLTDVTTSNPAYLTEAGERYAAELTVIDTDHYITAYSVTMGGIDITSTVYNNGNIVIPEVTGNVVITVVASAYTYLDPLIQKRRYTNQGDSLARLYSDKYTTLVTNFAYQHVGRVTEYPAKTDCDLYWEITNTGDEAIALGNTYGLGFGMISGSESEYIENNAIAYWQVIDNVSHSLNPGESISGTYHLKAGWQLILTTAVRNNAAISEQIRGNYIPETFDDYQLLTTLTNSTQDFPYISGGYKTVNYYSDNGQTLLGTNAGWPPKILDDAGPVEYDVLIRERITVLDAADDSLMERFVGFIDFDDSQTTYQSNYACRIARGAAYYNVWATDKIKATNSDMTLITNSRMNNNGTVIDIFVKEVV